MKTQIRVPSQERSKNTYNKILKSSTELFSSVGYFQTNTAEIAKNAGVSTGIVYGYFEDKKDIVSILTDNCLNGIHDAITKKINDLAIYCNFYDKIENVINYILGIFKNYCEFYTVIKSLLPTMPELKDRYNKTYNNVVKTTLNLLTEHNETKEHLKEKILLCTQMIEMFVENYYNGVYDNYNKEAIKSIITESVYNILK